MRTAAATRRCECCWLDCRCTAREAGVSCAVSWQSCNSMFQATTVMRPPLKNQVTLKIVSRWTVNHHPGCKGCNEHDMSICTEHLHRKRFEGKLRSRASLLCYWSAVLLAPLLSWTAERFDTGCACDVADSNIIDAAGVFGGGGISCDFSSDCACSGGGGCGGGPCSEEGPGAGGCATTSWLRSPPLARLTSRAELWLLCDASSPPSSSATSASTSASSMTASVMSPVLDSTCFSRCNFLRAFCTLSPAHDGQ